MIVYKVCRGRERGQWRGKPAAAAISYCHDPWHDSTWKVRVRRKRDGRRPACVGESQGESMTVPCVPWEPKQEVVGWEAGRRNQ